MLKKILLVLVVLVAALAVVIAMQPAELRLSRSITIDAPPERIFPHINNLHKWDKWSPWAKIDPKAKNEFSGPDEGKDAKFRWVSDHQEVGTGSMTIEESRPNENVKIRLDFEKPMTGTSYSDFVLKAEGNDKTLVTWSMQGSNNFVGKAMCLIFNVEKKVGGKFEQGLADLKAVVEKKS
jgi:hypothetical protein